MTRNKAIFLMAIIFCARAIIADSPIDLPPVYKLGDQSVEVAELMIRLSKGIVRDLAPPVTGAERIVTDATVSDEGTTRTYYIQGQDVYHNGHVYSTYWVRLSTSLTQNETMSMRVSMGHMPYPMNGQTLDEETLKVAGYLLNSLYDISELNLDHRRVVIDWITESEQDGAWLYELYGENPVCEHHDLNRFKIDIRRQTQRNRAYYETELHLPWDLLPPIK